MTIRNVFCRNVAANLQKCGGSCDIMRIHDHPRLVHKIKGLTKGMTPRGFFVQDAQPAGPCSRPSSCCPQDRHVGGWSCDPSKDTATLEMLRRFLETDAAHASLQYISTSLHTPERARRLAVGLQCPGPGEDAKVMAATTWDLAHAE